VRAVVAHPMHNVSTQYGEIVQIVSRIQ